MAPTFYVGSEAGLKKLDEYLLSRSYITGYQASKDDLTVHAAFTQSPSPQFVNVSRWFNHIEALLRISGVTAEGSSITVEGLASFPEEAIATPPVVEIKAAVNEDDDSDVDLFGEETEEEKKAAEDRAAAVKDATCFFILQQELNQWSDWIPDAAYPGGRFKLWVGCFKHHNLYLITFTRRRRIASMISDGRILWGDITGSGGGAGLVFGSTA